MQSVGKFRPVVALLRPANHPAVQISVRYGGGGGRPGARPGTVCTVVASLNILPLTSGFLQFYSV